MRKRKISTAAELVPENPTLESLRRAAAGCKACDLWRKGTQTVFGEGARKASVLFVGEQPGDKEDLAGKPFVGPAGRLLDLALERAGIDRGDVYVTNAVKHFNWEPRGKRRIHKKPNSAEITACRPWLDAELEVVDPDIVVCLGATAAQTLIGKDFRVSQRRGELIPWKDGRMITATVHPSAVLRAPDDAARRRERERFFVDISRVAEALKQRRQAPEVERLMPEAAFPQLDGHVRFPPLGL